MSTIQIKEGQQVRLLSKPNGCCSRYAPLTEGGIYTCLGFMGSNIVTTTDKPGQTASYWHGRVAPVNTSLHDI